MSCRFTTDVGVFVLPLMCSGADLPLHLTSQIYPAASHTSVCIRSHNLSYFFSIQCRKKNKKISVTSFESLVVQISCSFGQNWAKIWAGFFYQYYSVLEIMQPSNECQTCWQQGDLFSVALPLSATAWATDQFDSRLFYYYYYFFSNPKHKCLLLSALEQLNDRRRGGSVAAVGKLWLRAALKCVIEFRGKTTTLKLIWNLKKSGWENGAK